MRPPQPVAAAEEWSIPANNQADQQRSAVAARAIPRRRSPDTPCGDAEPTPPSIARLRSLDDAELLTLILEFAAINREAGATAAALLGRFGSVARTLAAHPEALSEVGGVTPGAVGLLHACYAGGLRLGRDGLRHRPRLDTLRRVVRHLMLGSDAMPVGQLRVLYLDSHDRLLADEAAPAGHGHDPVGSARAILRRALLLDAFVLLLAHSVVEAPLATVADTEATLRLAAMAGRFQVEARDHVILGADRQWLSRCRTGKM